MTKAQAKKHYGSYAAIARALKIAPQSLNCWGERPPKLRQFQLAHHSGGELKVDKACFTG